MLLFLQCAVANAFAAGSAAPRAWYADTAYVHTLCAKAKAYETINTDTSLRLAALAEQISRQDKYYYGIGCALQRISSVYTSRGNFETGLNINKQAIGYFILSAVNKEQKPLTHWTEGLVGTLSNSGNIHLSMGNFNQSMQMFYIALQLIQNTDRDSYTLAHIYNNIAALYLDMRQYDQSIAYMQKALANIPNKLSAPITTIVYTNMSIALCYKQDTTQSIEYAHKALKVAAVSKDPKLQYASLMMLGDLYANRGNDSSIYYFLQAIKYAQMLGAYENCAVLFKTGSAYDELRDYTRGGIYLHTALHIADSIATRTMKLNILDGLYHHYQVLSQYKEAFWYQNAYLQLKDSLRDEKNTEAINQLDARYRSSLKDRELQHKQILIIKQSASIDSKNRIIAAVTAGIAILLLLVVLLYWIYTFRQREQARKIIELQQEKEIEVLKAVAGAEEQERKRIAQELHDGVSGTLSVIKMRFSAFTDIVSQPGTTETIHLLDNVINDIRNTAHNLSPEMILEGGLQEAINFFCMSINQSGAIHIAVQYSGNIGRLSASFQLSVFRIIQELIQNVIKHAQARNVLLQLGLWENLFSLTIEDDGIGFDTRKGEVKTGLGLRNVTLRVKALQGDINIHSIPGSGTTIYMEFDTSEQE